MRESAKRAGPGLLAMIVVNVFLLFFGAPTWAMFGLGFIVYLLVLRP